MKLTFTKSEIEKIELPAGKSDMWAWDSDTAGLGLRLRRSAGNTISRTWYLSYTLAGVDKRDPIGKYSDLTLDDARALVGRRRRDLAENRIDPRQAVAAAEAKAQVPTLAKAADAYLARRDGKISESTRRSHERYLTGEYFRPLHTLPLDRITREHVAARINFIEDNGVEGGKPSKNAASQARTSLQEVYRFAIAEGWCSASPVTGTRNPAPPHEAVPRDRILTDPELITVWQAGDALVRLLILTGCRREEVGGMLWSEIDGNVWNLPAERTKNRLARRIPLAPMAVEILAGIPRIEGRDRVFSTLAWSYIKGKLPALEMPWTFHDLRRTMRSGLSAIGVLPHIAELCIGHKKEKLVATYDKAEHLDEQRAGIERWAAHVDGLIAARPSNVVPMRAA